MSNVCARTACSGEATNVPPIPSRRDAAGASPSRAPPTCMRYAHGALALRQAAARKGVLRSCRRSSATALLALAPPTAPYRAHLVQASRREAMRICCAPMRARRSWRRHRARFWATPTAKKHTTRINPNAQRHTAAATRRSLHAPHRSCPMPPSEPGCGHFGGGCSCFQFVYKCCRALPVVQLPRLGRDAAQPSRASLWLSTATVRPEFGAL